MTETPTHSSTRDSTSHRVDASDARSRPQESVDCRRSALDELLDRGPSPELMTRLRDLNPETLDGFDRVRVLQAWEGARGWVEAQGLSALRAVAGDQPVEVDDWVREEVAAALTLSGPAAQGRIDVARACHTRLAVAADALAAGQCSYLHLRTLVAETVDLSDEDASAVCERVVSKAAEQTLGRWRSTIRRAVHRLAPVTVEDAHAQACTRRKVQFWELPHGMAALYAELPAPDALTVWNAINLIARRTPALVHPTDPTGSTDPTNPTDANDPTSVDPVLAYEVKLGVDARRADALLELATRFLTDPNTTTSQGRRVELQVQMDLPTLLGLRHDGVAELVGYGPIPVSVARELAGDARWRRLVTDPVDGHLLDYGTTTYTPPAKLRDYIINRDQTCRHPGCRQPAVRNDIDHAEPFQANDNQRGRPPGEHSEQGGATSSANCGSLCRRHHRLKTLGLWTLKSHPDGTATWTSPTGHTYNTPPGPSP